MTCVHRAAWYAVARVTLDRLVVSSELMMERGLGPAALLRHLTPYTAIDNVLLRGWVRVQFLSPWEFASPRSRLFYGHVL